MDFNFDDIFSKAFSDKNKNDANKKTDDFENTILMLANIAKEKHVDITIEFGPSGSTFDVKPYTGLRYICPHALECDDEE